MIHTVTESLTDKRRLESWIRDPALKEAIACVLNVLPIPLP